MNVEKVFDARFASDVKELDSIPAGYINKTVCGCGLTSLAIEKEKGNTIIAVPSVDLVNNKVDQYPNERFSDELLGVTGDTDKEMIERFVAARPSRPYKIMVTYDSINKVKHLLPYSHLVIDESDRLLSWMPIKASSKKMTNVAVANEAMDVISNLLDIAESYKDSVSFISATPVPIDYFKRDWMKQIDQITYNWSKSITSQPILMERSFPLMALKDEIIFPLKRDGQVTIGGCTFKKVLVFFNSVEGVNQLIEEAMLPLDECGIKCGDSLKNATHTKVKRLTGCTGFPKYSFITSSAFSGSDIYDDEAMTIVMSNTKRNWQMIDLQTDLKQAISRQRKETNPNYGKYIFIYNQSVFKLSENDLLGRISSTRKRISDNISTLNESLAKKDARYKSNLQSFCSDSDFVAYTILKDNKWTINEMRFSSDEYFITNTRKAYTKGFQLMNDVNPIVVEAPKNDNPLSYTNIAEKYQLSLDGVDVTWTEDELHCKHYITISTNFQRYGKIESNQSRAKKLANATADLQSAKSLAESTFTLGKRYTATDAKEMLQQIYDELGIQRKAQTKDLYELFDSVSKKKINGNNYIILD